jgi:hypothetical protein
MIHFLRYAPLVARQGGQVVVECPDFHIPLFATCRGAGRLVPHGARYRPSTSTPR